ncbi:MAG: GIY-YIG nuclease family protein [Patescibacteria group bacterium]
MFFVYILKSQYDKKLYIGYTSDLRRRFMEHASGKVESTRNRRPLEIIYYEAFKYEKDARNQELFYKTGQGRRVLKTRIKTVILEK